MLLKVPNEILSIIAENLGPGDLLSLLLTCRACHYNLSYLMLRHALADKDRIPALIWAAAKNHVPLLKTVVAHTPASDEATENESKALNEACCSGSLEAVQFLLDHGVPYAQHDNERTPLGIAVWANQIPVVSLFLSRGASPDQLWRWREPLTFDLCRNGRVEMLRVLLASGADPNIRNEHMSSCLTLAVEYGHLDCVQVLVEYGAEVDVVDVDNDTPLILALYCNKMDVVDFLLEQEGCDYISANNRGFDPLLLACLRGRVDVVERCFSKQMPGIDSFWYEQRLLPLVSVARRGDCLEVAEFLEQEILRLWLMSSML